MNELQPHNIILYHIVLYLYNIIQYNKASLHNIIHSSISTQKTPFLVNLPHLYEDIHWSTTGSAGHQGKHQMTWPFAKGKVGYPWESTPRYQHIPPIYGIYNGCMG